jgi:hypothetical protein
MLLMVIKRQPYPLGERKKVEKMDGRQVEDVGPQRSQQLTILEIIFAGAIAAILTGGLFTLWTTMVGITLLLALHAYDAKADYSWVQGAAFSAVWALSVILATGVLFNFFWPDIRLWHELAYACKQGIKGSELAIEELVSERRPAGQVYVCSAGPFWKADSLREYLAGFNAGDVRFSLLWLLSGLVMFAYRRIHYARA